MQAVAELQQQVADLKLEKEQLLKAVTEQQHDAACLAEHVAQIGQLKQVLANLQQHNAELEINGKASWSLCASKPLHCVFVCTHYWAFEAIFTTSSLIASICCTGLSFNMLYRPYLPMAEPLSCLAAQRCSL